MSNKTLTDMLEKQKEIARRIPRSPRIIKGSLVELKRTCGKSNCRCRKGEKHRSLYLSQSKSGKTKMTYIPRKYEKEVREYVKRHKRHIKVLDELSELNIKIIKHKV